MNNKIHIHVLAALSLLATSIFFTVPTAKAAHIPAPVAVNTVATPALAAANTAAAAAPNAAPTAAAPSSLTDNTNASPAPGLWFPHQVVEDDLFARLKEGGLKLSKKEIYRLNERCLTGTILSLSGQNGVASPFASASFISADGLVLTNFHCVSSYVQQLASAHADFMQYGCWATSREQEAPLFGLEAHQMLSCEDVTDLVLSGADTIASADERERYIDQQARSLMNSRNERYGVSKKVYSMMGGTQYILIRYRSFYDIRVVACPPMWLGKFGGDTDNWAWPRYSCDFAILRVYSTLSNSSTYYTKQNVPYRPASWLKIARRPVGEGDLALVAGYPSQTRKHIPALAVDRIVNADTRLRADFLKAKIDFLSDRRDKAPADSRTAYDVRIGKFMNTYLRSMGEIQGVEEHRVVEQKREADLQLQEWINASADRTARYGHNLVYQMDTIYSRLSLFNHMNEAFLQLVSSGPTIIPFAGKFEKLASIDRANRKTRAKDMEQQIPETRRNMQEYFAGVDLAEDLGMLRTLLPIYREAVPDAYLPEALRRDSTPDIEQLFNRSILTDRERLTTLLDQAVDSGLQPLSADPLYRICLDLYSIRVQRQMKEDTRLRRANTRLYNAYTQARQEKMQGEAIEFDANHTMRISAGRVLRRTQLSDMIARLDSMRAHPDFKMSIRFRHLLESHTGSLPTACFTTNAETVAGNSGSAIVDARGHLIGLNFDRTAESTYSIYVRQPADVQNIAVSIDYILWVLRYYSRSTYILDELDFK